MDVCSPNVFQLARRLIAHEFILNAKTKTEHFSTEY